MFLKVFVFLTLIFSFKPFADNCSSGFQNPKQADYQTKVSALKEKSKALKKILNKNDELQKTLAELINKVHWMIEDSYAIHRFTDELNESLDAFVAKINKAEPSLTKKWKGKELKETLGFLAVSSRKQGNPFEKEHSLFTLLRVQNVQDSWRSDMIEVLKKFYVDFEKTGGDSLTAFQKAVKESRELSVILKLGNYSNYKKPIKNGYNILFLTVNQDKDELTKILMEKFSIDINEASSKTSLNLLAYAISQNKPVTFITSLIGLGADIFYKIKKELPVLMYLLSQERYHSNKDIFKLIKRSKKELNSVIDSSKNNNLLHLALNNNLTADYIGLFLKAGVDPFAKNKTEDIPVFMSIRKANYTLITEVLDHWSKLSPVILDSMISAIFNVYKLDLAHAIQILSRNESYYGEQSRFNQLKTLVNALKSSERLQILSAIAAKKEKAKEEEIPLEGNQKFLQNSTPAKTIFENEIKQSFNTFLSAIAKNKQSPILSSEDFKSYIQELNAKELVNHFESLEQFINSQN